ncbi:MAG: radical SAM protein [Bacteroidales bacterium]|nr:radical SAM protein [Bacteroidales bacterium]
MSGILFNDIIFGPIRSRRLGNSLGINLLPGKHKVCTFNCIYCECGWGESGKNTLEHLLSAAVIIPIIEQTMKHLHDRGEKIDSITYSGNGEPTIHPEFEVITDAVIALRNKYFPKSIITCLSNSTQLHRPDVVAALKKIDNPLLKLDTGLQETFERMNKPFIGISLDTICRQLRLFEGKVTIQSMFLRGTLEDGNYIDNTTEHEVQAWLKRLEFIRPHTVMMYPIDRETPATNLVKIDKATLEKIAREVRKLNIQTLTYN